MQVTLDQWQALLAIVDQGGYAQAAEHLNKSQSAVSYTISKLEETLGFSIFQIEGRRAQLSPAGNALLHHARQIIEHAKRIEDFANTIAKGQEPDIKLTVDNIFPAEIMLNATERFSKQQPETRITLIENALSGTVEALLKREADIVIGNRVPPGFFGESLMSLTFIPAAHPQHPIHFIDAPITLEKLSAFRQLVVRDPGSRNENSGWLGADQRWSFSNMNLSIAYACNGLGFAWYPEFKITQQIQSGLLQPIQIEPISTRNVQLYLTLSDGDYSRPGVKLLAQMIQEETQLFLTSKC